ncbi:MAG: hypothetical protein Q3998_06035 [Porphyromonas sp.]|nr:hypothetical protein [Porphyromonas sp.]
MKQHNTFALSATLRNAKENLLLVLTLLTVLSSIALLSTEKAMAQTNPTRTSIELGLTNLNLKVEKNLERELSVDGSIGLQSYFFYRSYTTLDLSDNELGYKLNSEKLFGYGVVPFVEIGGNWYYNLLKREAIGKSVENNSANYLRAAVAYVHTPLIHRPNNIITPPQIDAMIYWGLRRQLAEKLFFNFNIGTGTSFINPFKEFDLYFNLRIGLGLMYSF